MLPGDVGDEGDEDTEGEDHEVLGQVHGGRGEWPGLRHRWSCHLTRARVCLFTRVARARPNFTRVCTKTSSRAVHTGEGECGKYLNIEEK